MGFFYVLFLASVCSSEIWSGTWLWIRHQLSAFSLNRVWPFFPSFGILKMLIILNWNLRLIVVPIIGCLCINYTALRLWGVNLRERKWWKDSWWQNYEIRTSVRWRMDWGLSCAFCLFTFLCFCVLNIMHRENVWYSWLAWIHHGWLKLGLG